MRKLDWMFLFFILTFSSVKLFGQSSLKVDRLPEVESELKNEVVEYVARFIPKSSFSVFVKINPVRRAPQAESNVDILPFYETAEETNLDEWDNPDISYYVLLNRIQEAQISISIDGNYSIKNESDFRENLFKSVGLISGRDKLELKSTDMKTFEKKFSTNDINWTYVLIGFLGIFTLGLMYFGINRFTDVHKRAQNIANQGNKEASPSAAPMPLMGHSGMMGSLAGSSKSFGESSKINGDINFTDSLKINSYLKEKINLISNESNVFPTLGDLKILEDLMNTDLYGFSYFISQFKQEEKEKIFSLGRSQDWIKGFAEIGVPSKDILLYLEKMIHAKRERSMTHVDQLIIQCWRLKNQLKDFLITIPRNEVKCILFLLPKELSLPIAREMFPGDWAFILAEKLGTDNLSDADAKKLLGQALNFKPYFDSKMIQIYKNKEELVSYLRSCTPDEEKEIYQSIDGTYSLSLVRPPFYSFFELEFEARSQIFRHYDLRTWSIACFNMSRMMRAKLDELMNDKEKYLFKNYLTELDKSRPQDVIIADIRETISREVAQFISSLPIQSTHTINTQKNVDNNEQAA